MELSLIDPRIEYLAIPKEFINNIAVIKTSKNEPIFRHLIQRNIENFYDYEKNVQKSTTINL